MKKRILLIPIAFSLSQPILVAQDDKGTFSGSLTTNNQFFVKDEKIGANTELYERQLTGTEAWLVTNYGYKGFNFAARFDLFNNSNLYNPSKAYSNSGLGMWQVSKDVDNLNVTAGYFYDQFGSGTMFRAYEDRNLGIDYAIQGVRVKYQPVKKLNLKAFTGRQKYRFGIREPVIKGANAEYTFNIKKVQVEAGTSILNRTMDDVSMNLIVNAINNQPVLQRFDPKYNMCAYNAYSSITWKNFRFFLEYASKSKEAIKNTNLPTQPLEYKGGQVYFASTSYSKTGFGFNAQYKRIEGFPVRTSPNEKQLDGVMNYLPSITRQNTYRLLARYNAVVQELGEEDFQADFLYTHKNKKKLKTQVSGNASYVRKLTGEELFHEFYLEVSKEYSKKVKWMLGVQQIGYNQQVYEAKGSEYPFVNALTPFGEFNYKFSKKTSTRIEFQFLKTGKLFDMKDGADLGSFLNLLAEFNMAPHWSFALGDMVNIAPWRAPGFKGISNEKLHYYTFFAAYTEKATRFTLGYVKQVAGVNCTGGVCRVEPAFSGLKFTVSTSF